MVYKNLNIDSKYNLSKIDIFENEQECLNHVLAHILQVNVTEIKLMKEINLSVKQHETLNNILDLMCNKHVPFQYINGIVNVYNEKYIVTPDVLIPRQDTECLIEQTINCININSLEKMLDLCTGSGVVGISVAKNSNIQKVTLLDISDKAINIANKNIELNNVSNKCSTIVSDLFNNLVDRQDKYDIITANPPYISYNEYEKLSTYVKQEPKLALVAKDNGLYFYKKIATEAKEFLTNNGWLIFEIGYMQGNEIKDILKQEGYIDIDIIKDLNLNDRVVICRFQSK